MSSNLRPANLFGSYNNRLPQGKINATKGTGPFSYQVGNTYRNMRGYFNKDYFNDTPAPFGKPRPLKHYRKGRVIPHYINVVDSQTNQEITIDANAMRNINSSTFPNMVSQMLWLPGAYTIKPNPPKEINNVLQIQENCQNCKSTAVVSNWKYNIANITEKPNNVVANKLFCCNEEYKAKKRVLPASTLTQRNYFTTTYQYLQNRCQTYDQRNFNFVRGTQLTPDVIKNIITTLLNSTTATTDAEIEVLIRNAKPGSPLSYYNIYVAQCQPNTEILRATVQSLIAEMILILKNDGYINETQYNNMISLSFQTIPELINYIQGAFPKTQANEMGDVIYFRIYANPLLSQILEGPSSQSGCSRVYYKPSNPEFAVEGSVQSSLRTLALNVETINKNIYLNKKLLGIQTAEILTNTGGLTSVPYIYKAKYGTDYSKNYKNCCIQQQ